MAEVSVRWLELKAMGLTGPINTEAEAGKRSSYYGCHGPLSYAEDPDLQEYWKRTKTNGHLSRSS